MMRAAAWAAALALAPFLGVAPFARGEHEGLLAPPSDCLLCDGDKPGIVTYAGKDKLQYIDGAVMLGISLKRHVPEYPRVCLVVATMPEAYKRLLSKYWHVLDVPEWHPTQSHFDHGYWWQVYDKINVFRLGMKTLLYMDADMYVVRNKLRDVLNTKLAPERVGMVRDCCTADFNSGLMLFHPNLTAYHNIHEAMTRNSGWAGLDQPLINAEYGMPNRDRIHEFPAVFNAHGHTEAKCEDVVVAHFTGPMKPTFANAGFLGFVRTGPTSQFTFMRCAEYYRRFYCDLQVHKADLSKELQEKLGEVDGGCLA